MWLSPSRAKQLFVLMYRPITTRTKSLQADQAASLSAASCKNVRTLASTRCFS